MRASGTPALLAESGMAMVQEQQMQAPSGGVDVHTRAPWMQDVQNHACLVLLRLNSSVRGSGVRLVSMAVDRQITEGGRRYTL